MQREKVMHIHCEKYCEVMHLVKRKGGIMKSEYMFSHLAGIYKDRKFQQKRFLSIIKYKACFVLGVSWLCKDDDAGTI